MTGGAGLEHHRRPLLGSGSGGGGGSDGGEDDGDDNNDEEHALAPPPPAAPILPRLSYEAVCSLTGPIDDITGLAPVPARAPPKPWGGARGDAEEVRARARRTATPQSLFSLPRPIRPTSLFL